MNSGAPSSRNYSQDIAVLAFGSLQAIRLMSITPKIGRLMTKHHNVWLTNGLHFCSLKFCACPVQMTASSFFFFSDPLHIPDLLLSLCFPVPVFWRRKPICSLTTKTDTLLAKKGNSITQPLSHHSTHQSLKVSSLQTCRQVGRHTHTHTHTHTHSHFQMSQNS